MSNLFGKPLVCHHHCVTTTKRDPLCEDHCVKTTVWQYHFAINYRFMHYNNRGRRCKWWNYDLWGCAVDMQPKNEKLCSKGQLIGQRSLEIIILFWKNRSEKKNEEKKRRQLIKRTKACNVYFIQAHYLLNTAPRIHWPVFLVA